MPVSGNFEPQKLLSTKLNADSLLLLCRDLLYSRGHRSILIMNGPGDGQRDVHSVSPTGLKHLTQCKFHRDFSRTCSSRELGELPLAMMKFSYQTGLFLTNSAISPQGKREFLNDYPSLELEFLDGHLLSIEVMEDALLKLAWFDGVQIFTSETTVSIPVILRRHSDDHPISPFESTLQEDVVLKDLGVKWPTIKFAVQKASRNYEDFAPYRPPAIPTIEEGFSQNIQVAEIIASGQFSLSEVSELSNQICSLLLTTRTENKQGLSIVAGLPYLFGATRMLSGQTVYLAEEKKRLTRVAEVVYSEHDFFQCSSSKYWSVNSDARASEAESIRLYNSELDCALSYEMSYEISYELDPKINSLRAISRLGWQASVHALVPSWHQSWPYAEIPQPDESIDWKWSNHRLCTWLHWTVLGEYAIQIPSWERDFPKEYLDEFGKSSHYLNSIRDKLTKIQEIKMLAPDTARHMGAIVGNDVLDENLNWTYHSGNLAHFYEDCRKPLLPEKREFYPIVVWQCSIDENTFRKLADRSFGAEFGKTVYKDDQYLLLVLSPRTDQRTQTCAILDTLHESLKAGIESLDFALSEVNSDSKRSTFQYWKQKYNVSLGHPWNTTGKKYIGLSPEEVGFKTIFENPIRLLDVNGSIVAIVLNSEMEPKYESKPCETKEEALLEANTWLEWRKGLETDSNTLDSICYVVAIPPDFDLSCIDSLNPDCGLTVNISLVNNPIVHVEELQKSNNNLLVIQALEPGSKELEKLRLAQFKDSLNSDGWYSWTSALANHIYATMKNNNVLPNGELEKLIRRFEK